MNKFVCLLMLSCFVFNFSIVSLACNPEPGVQHFPGVPKPQPPAISSGIFEVHTTLTGLPTNKILSIKMFKKKVYVGTADKGLLIYNGRDWKMFNPQTKPVFPSFSVTAIVSKGEDELLAGTPIGLISIKLDNKKFKFVKKNIASDDNLNVSDIGFVRGKDSYILLTCARKAGYVVSHSFAPYKLDTVFAPPGFSCVGTNESGIYFGSDQGLFIAQGNRLVKYQTNEEFGWVNDISSLKKQCFIAAANGTYILAGKNPQEVLPGIWSTCLGINAKPEFEKELPPQPIMKVDQIGELADQAYEKALEARDKLFVEFQNYRERAASSPPSKEEVSEMWGKFADISSRLSQIRIETPLEKGLWIGTHDQGLILISKNGTRYHLTYDTSKLPSDNITAIDCDKTGEAWFGTSDGGLLHYFKRSRTIRPKLKKLLSCKPTRVRILGGRLVVGTKEHGMYLYDLKSKQLISHMVGDKETKFHRHVTDFAIDPEGTMWVTGDLGLIKIGDKGIETIGFSQENIPSDIPERVSVDKFGKVFVAFSNSSKMSSQVYSYNGEGLENLDVKKLKQILVMPTKQKKDYMEFMGLSGTYQREFLAKNASETIKNFDKTIASPVSALLNLPNYLLIGTKSGLQNIFDGESYKPLSTIGTGNRGEILNFKILPNKSTLIQAVGGITIFDGYNYKELLPIGGGIDMTDICPDARNPETFWVSYTNGVGGGIALYEKPYWSRTKIDKPIYSLAVDSNYVYVALKDGVYYLAP